MRVFPRPRLVFPILALTGAALGIGAAAARPAGPTSHTPAFDGGCRVELADSSDTADADRARRTCEYARARFSELFGETAPAARVVLWPQVGYRVATQGRAAVAFWPTTQTLAERFGSGDVAKARVEDQWHNVLPHEITHALVAAHFFGSEREPRQGGYGSPFPDWLDEGAAIWAESEDNRRYRLEDFRNLPEEWKDLRAILAMPHPALGNAAAFAARDGGPIPRDRALWAFYPQSFAVVTFIFDAGGSEAFRELARRLVEDPTDLEALAGLPGLPDTMDEVAAAWDAWRRAPQTDWTAPD